MTPRRSTRDRSRSSPWRVILLAATFLFVRQPDETKTVTAHFPRAVSVYKGTDVRVLGVNVGRVTAVIPEGNSVRVEMEYDADVRRSPRTPRPSIVTPTLVADRFVQLTPAYTSGPVMKDGADIALPDTGVPVELDRIYASLSRPRPRRSAPTASTRTAPSTTCSTAGANALDGQGQRGNEMIRKLSAAAQTFGEGSGPLFDTVAELAQFTDTLATNDKFVRGVHVGPGRGVLASWPPSAARSRRRSPPWPTRSARSARSSTTTGRHWSDRRREAHPADEDASTPAQGRASTPRPRSARSASTT